MPTAASDRCEFDLDVGLPGDDFTTDPCDRPVWEDHDRCIWHAAVDGKTTDQLEEFRPDAGEDLSGAYLEEAHLVGVDMFADTTLVNANLNGATVNSADFTGADLTLATLSDASAIGTDFREANLEGATFTNADLRRTILDDALLNDAVFTNVHIDSHTSFGETSVYERGEAEPSLSDDHSLAAAAWAYRQLQDLYRDNGLPRRARRSYTLEKDARRRLAWAERGFAEAVKWELSRLVMRYGSSPYRVLLTSLVVITVSAILYPLTGGIEEVQGGTAITYTLENPEDAPPWWIGEVLFRSFYFSVVTFATLGYGDIRPVGGTARLLAGVETILGTLLTALLVFVLARIVTW